MGFSTPSTSKARGASPLRDSLRSPNIKSIPAHPRFARHYHRFSNATIGVQHPLHRHQPDGASPLTLASLVMSLVQHPLVGH